MSYLRSEGSLEPLEPTVSRSVDRYMGESFEDVLGGWLSVAVLVDPKALEQEPRLHPGEISRAATLHAHDEMRISFNTAAQVNTRGINFGREW